MLSFLPIKKATRGSLLFMKKIKTRINYSALHFRWLL